MCPHGRQQLSFEGLPEPRKVQIISGKGHSEIETLSAASQLSSMQCGPLVSSQHAL